MSPGNAVRLGKGPGVRQCSLMVTWPSSARKGMMLRCLGQVLLAGVPRDKNNIAVFPYELQPPERYIPMGSLLFLFFKTASHPGSWAVKWAMLCYHSAIV